MAILTALLSALSRKLGSLIQAVMGWSVAALFGQLPSKKRLFVSIALMLSLTWPLFVVGVFFPAAATFVIAFIPVKGLVGAEILRAVWIGLAILAPPAVGLLTRAALPAAHGLGVGKMMLQGFPLALGFAISFLVTLVTVPALKLASLVRRWEDVHLFVQPKLNRYEAALHDVCEACVRAGLTPEVKPLPRPMSLATRVIKRFARGGLDGLVVDDPKMVRADQVELYLYPGDLLLRGEKHRVGRVRAMLGQTLLERDAYLVETERAQRLQDALGRLWEIPESRAKARLAEIAAATTQPDITYEDWVMLDRIARKLEGALNHQEPIVARGSLEEAAAAAAEPANDASTGALLAAALKESRALIHLEVELAKLEAKRTLKQTLRAAIFLGAAGVFAVLTLTMLAVAAVFALGGTAAAALVLGSVFLSVAAAAGWFGYSQLPKHPFARTRQHLEDDLTQLKEHVA